MSARSIRMRWVRGAVPVLAAIALAACGRNLSKADAHEALGDSMMNNGAFPAAAGEYMQSASYDGNEPRRWLKFARAQREAGNAGQAANGFQRALDLDPANVEALENLSVLMVRAGRYDEVHTYLDPLLVLSPDDLAGTLASGAIALHERRFDAARTIADRLIASAPSSPEGFLLKAHVLAADGRPGDGARLLAGVVADRPTDANLAEELLGLYRLAGQREGIRATSLLLAKLRPDEPRYGMEAVRALHARGEDEAAARQLDTVTRRFGTNTEVMEAVAFHLIATLPHDRAVAEIARLADGRPAGVRAMLAGKLVRLRAPEAALGILQPGSTDAVTNANVDVQASYADALFAAGRGDAALHQADKVLAFDGSNDVALTVRARAAMARRDWAAALADAQAVAADKPGDADAALLVARIHDASGNQILAAQAYGDAAARVPDSLAVVTARIAWMQAHGQAATAKAIAAQFATTHPQMAAARALHAAACRVAGDRSCPAVARGGDVGI